MAAETTQVLAQFAAGLTYDDIPAAAREHAKNLLLDALACALAGHQGEETAQVEALAAALAQSDETSIIGGDKLSLTGATLLNGYLITAVTMCDVHRPTLTHAALLAEQKFVATREFLTAKDGGLFNAYARGGKPDLATAGLGTRWELEQIALRLWPSASSFQGMNTALFDLVEQHRIEPARVKQVRVGLSQPAFDLHGGLARYKGKFEAMISAHYTAAVIVHDRALTLAQFDPSRYDDPTLKRAAAEQVEVRADPALTGVQATADIEMVDGSKLSARCEHPRGSPENPLSRAQIVDKLRTYAPDRISAAAIDEVVRSVDRLEDLSSVRDLMNALRATPRAERVARRAGAR